MKTTLKKPLMQLPPLGGLVSWGIDSGVTIMYFSALQWKIPIDKKYIKSVFFIRQIKDATYPKERHKTWQETLRLQMWILQSTP